MPDELRFLCPLVNGVHARPASALADVARSFRANMTISRQGSPAADLRSVLSVVGLDIKLNQECIVVAEGQDSAAAIQALAAFVRDTLPTIDDVSELAAGSQAGATGRLPHALTNIDVAYVPGRAVCGGIGIGKAVVVHGLALSDEAMHAKPDAIDKELESVLAALNRTRDELSRRAAGAGQGMASDLLKAHAAIADDPALRAIIESHVRASQTAARAVVAAGEEFASRLRAAGSAYIRDRAVDVLDVCAQVLEHLGCCGESKVTLSGPSVVFADALTANQLLGLDRDLLRGLVLGSIGATSHTVILARSFQIPTVIDVPGAGTGAAPSEDVIVDGEGGLVITDPSEIVRRYFERERRAHERLQARHRSRAITPARSTDGFPLEVGVNASTPEEVRRVVEHGADGVGLLRTELLFLDRARAPSEDEQFEAYAAVVRAAGGKPVIIRTFDIGGDKPAAYLHIPKEENPFLGLRGLRLYHAHPEVLRDQLRAILHAASLGPVKIMAPMIATPDEAAWFRSQVEAMIWEIKGSGGQVPDHVPVGIMLEVPAVAMVMDQLCDVVDFFSIGTNDMCQYWMAVDRGNPGVASLYNPRQPSFLRLLRTIVAAAREQGKWIGVCGEMAGRRENLPLMLGLGLDEISVAPGEVPALKSMVGAASAEQCRGLLARACECRSPAQVDELVASWPWRAATSSPIVDRELITVGSDSRSKDEAIQEAVGLLFASGRVENARMVEEAVWAREATYSTGLGFGFAIPHCKSESATSPSLSVVRLADPIDWGSLDGQPVSMVLLLVVPASDTAGSHMKVFAKLARRLMHEQFRDRMLAAKAPTEVEACLQEELELS